MQLYSKKLKRGAFGKPDVPFLQPEGRTYSPPPHFGVSGGIAYGNRALSEGMRILRKPFSFCVKRNKNERT